MIRKILKTLLSLFIMVLFTQIIYGQTVTIGTQVWMTKNLNVDKFRNGDPIPQAKTPEEWETAGKNKQPAWCYYDYDPANGAKYGKLYNWYAVNNIRGLAPMGYHIPTDADWTKLEKFLSADAGKKMKSASGWASLTESKTCPNCVNWSAEYRRKVPCHTCRDTRSVAAPKKTGNGTNSSRFSGLPGGARNSNGSFGGVGENGYWWSSSNSNMDDAWYRYLSFDSGTVTRYYSNKKLGLSVRCLRD
jgi:uncharacterized protein (TIGR02145 family)